MQIYYLSRVNPLSFGDAGLAKIYKYTYIPTYLCVYLSIHIYIYIDLNTEIKAPINADTNIILTHLLADYFFIGDARII